MEKSDGESWNGGSSMEEERGEVDRSTNRVDDSLIIGEGEVDGQRKEIGHFKRIIPVEMYDTELPLAGRKVFMERRRPLWLPQLFLDEHLYKEASYFSESWGKEQLLKQAVFNKFYKPQLGDYAYSKAELTGRTYTPKAMKGVQCVRFSPGGNYIVLGCGNGTIQINNRQENNTSVHSLDGCRRKITCIRFSPGQDEGPFYASSLTGRVHLAKRENEEWHCSTLFQEMSNEINAMDLNMEGTFLATAGMDSHIRIYDPNNEKLTQMYLRPGTLKEANKKPTIGVPDSGHYRRICALKYHPENLNVFITGGWDDLIKVWDVRTPAVPAKTIVGPHLLSNAIDVMGNVIMSGQWTCKEGIQMWDMRSTGCLITVEPLNRPLNNSGEFINDVQFFRTWDENGPICVRGDLIIAAGTGTKALEVISIKQNMILHRSEEANAVVTLDHHQSSIAYGAVSHIYGVVNFIPFAYESSIEMDFRDKKTDERKLKEFSIGGNPMGWQEVAIDLDFQEGVKETEKDKKSDSGEETSGVTEEKRGIYEKQARRIGPKTYEIDLAKARRYKGNNATE